MGFHKSLTLSILLWTAQVVLGEFWEFGRADVPGSVEITRQEGKMGFFERRQTIALPSSRCHEITYIKVNVNSLRQSPQVHYDNKMNTIIISYGFMQNSKSSYDIVAKAVWAPGCITSPQQQQQAPPKAMEPNPNPTNMVQGR